MAGTDIDDRISTSVLARCVDVDRKKLFGLLERERFIRREGEKWVLEDAGRDVGGTMQEKGGESWLVWARSGQGAETLAGLIQAEFKVEGVLGLMRAGAASEKPADEKDKPAGAERRRNDPRERRESATYCCEDGHYVRSRAELIIDNYLYHHRIVHAYERRVPVLQQEQFCDFYVPEGSVYIEFWGLESDPEYVTRKKQKIRVYQKNKIQLIELRDSDLTKLDDILPRRLSKFGVRAAW
jgi:hypothetical protein